MMKTKVINFLKKYWIYAPLILVAWSWFTTNNELTKTKAILSSERLAWKQAVVVSEKNKKVAEAQYQKTVDLALSSYTDWVEKQKPIIVQSTNTVKEYAKTDMGKSICLDADGVQRFQRQRDLLYSADPQTP